MEQLKVSSGLDKSSTYRELLPQLQSLVSGESDATANLANISAALKQALPYASWIGFYLLKDSELVVGPFQGKVACTRIKVGRGVCGTSAATGKTLIVPDVNKFPGHIFCDHDSKSEIVVPVLKNGKTVGVLDLDSSTFDSFDHVDSENLEAVAEIAASVIDGS